MTTYFSHESAYVDDNVNIGDNTKDMAFFTYLKWFKYWS